MSKEITLIPAFDFSPGSQTPFDMIISGGFDFGVSTPEPPPLSLNPELTVSQKFKSINPIASLEDRIALKKNRLQPQRMTKREWLVQEIKSNVASITNLNEAAFYAARRQEIACAPGDGHGMQSPSLQISSGAELSFNSNKANTLTGVKHESGKHDHCSHGNDYGSCPEGCKKAA